MKKVKKVLFIMSLLTIIFVKNVFADIPNGTVVIGDKAFSLEYAKNKAHEVEIGDLLLKNNKEVYIKTIDGKWIDNWSNEIIDRNILPEVIYTNEKNERIKYKKSDGKKVIATNDLIITFKDKKLEHIIRKKIRKDRGDILKSDVAKITQIYGYNEGIFNLDGIQYLTNLKYLNLSYNNIKDISQLKNLKNLKELNIINNEIKSVKSLKNIESLKKLYLIGNQIRDFNPISNIYNDIYESNRDFKLRKTDDGYVLNNFYYIIRGFDMFYYSLAKRNIYWCSVEEGIKLIREANPHISTSLHYGDKIIVPGIDYKK